METTTEENGVRMTTQQGLACRRLLNNPEYHWTRVCGDGQKDRDGKPNGHSFWRDQLTGMVSLCDQSGERPHLTDDGVLWVDDGRPWVLGDENYAEIPLVHPDGERTRSGTTWLIGLRIAKHLGAQVLVPKASRLAKLLPLLRDLPIEE